MGVCFEGSFDGLLFTLKQYTIQRFISARVTAYF